MSLATRCPACGTIFRVVQDQLKVSEGWVRCGQCHEVFHGIEALFDLDSDPALAARRAARGAPSQTPSFAPTRPPDIDVRTPAPPAAAVVPPPAKAPMAQTPSPPRFDAPRPAPSPAPAPVVSGFTPAGGPPAAPVPMVSPMMRRTIAPRFAARLAEESARAQAAQASVRPTPDPEPPAPPPATASVWKPPAPAPAVAAPKAPIAAPTPAPVSMPPATPATATAPSAVAAAPHPAPAPAPTAGPAPIEAEVPLPDLDLSEPAPAASAIEDFSTPTSRQPRTISARDAAPPADVAKEVPAQVASPPKTAPSTPPSRPIEDDDEDDGPLTLASMLPDASEWPRPEPRKRRRSKPPAASSAAASAASAASATPATPEAKPEELAPTEEDTSSHDARFLREAQRQARWNKPWVRAALIVTLFVLALGAGGQVAWPMRDTLASRYPATRPAWDLLCEQLGCTIEAPRALASLALDGSSLTRTNTEHVLLFSADLHNRSDQEVRMPSFDLTFTDLNGAIVARKVLSPEQIGIPQKALAPDAELHVHARLQVGSLDASGFQAYLFYP